MDKNNLEKMLGYKFPERITEADKTLIKNTFNGNEDIWPVLKKVFLPSAIDPNMPIEFQPDLLTEIDFASLSAEEAKTVVLARQYMIKGTLGAMMLLKTLAYETSETQKEVEDRQKKNSSK